MDKKQSNTQDPEVRKGPRTMEEELILINYVANHSEGVWNSLAKAAGLKRTGKSCRLRWLNYLRPDLRRGNITPEEQLFLDHGTALRVGKQIAKHLPGRTDNEIKKFWRTRIKKHIKKNDPHQSFPTQHTRSDHMSIHDHHHTSTSSSSTGHVSFLGCLIPKAEPSHRPGFPRCESVEGGGVLGHGGTLVDAITEVRNNNLYMMQY